MKKLFKELEKKGYNVHYYKEDNTIHVEGLIKNDYIEINETKDKKNYFLLTENTDERIDKKDLIDKLKEYELEFKQ